MAEERPRSSKARRHTFCSSTHRDLVAEGDLQDTQSTGTRPQTSPERSGRRGPQVHPVDCLFSTRSVSKVITQKFGLRHLVGDHISLCTTWSDRECEPSVSAPWTSTWVMGLSVGRERFVRFEGAVCTSDEGKRCGASGRTHMAPRWSLRSATLSCGRKRCMSNVYFYISAGQIAKSLSGQLT